MDAVIQNELIQAFQKAFVPPWDKGIAEWAHEYIDLPSAYAIPGKVDLTLSPYLLEPLKALENPKIRQLNLVAGVQTGKSLLSELFIPYTIINAPGPLMRIFQNDEVSNTFSDTRLKPILHSCPLTNPLMSFKRYTAKKKDIIFPHMAIKMSGAHESISHGASIKYLILDECHCWNEIGLIEKFIARTVAFAGRRKIILCSQPNQHDSELYKYYSLGKVYEWNWCCPKCSKYQPWRWYWQRPDLSYAGMNWKTVLMPDNETTNIAESAKSGYLECYYCREKLYDTTENRRLLNDTGRYECIKSDGDSEVVSYTWPGFVNINLSFEYFIAQYLNAKRVEFNTGLTEDLITFHNQVLGRFWKGGIMVDVSKIMRGEYNPDPNDKTDQDWVRILTADYQQRGRILYYILREWKKTGNESRRLDFGVCKNFDELEAIRQKWNVRIPCVGVDSGFDATTIYQECLKHGKPYKLPNGHAGYDCWTPLKGDGQKLVYRHEDGIDRYYSKITKSDPCFPIGSKFRGLSAPLVLWSNYSIKTIMANLRDNKIPGVKWLIDKPDKEYEKHMYSEGLVWEVDKKSGLKKPRWKQGNDDNHWFDAEAMNLVMAIRAKVFSAVQVKEDETLKKLIEPQDAKK